MTKRRKIILGALLVWLIFAASTILIFGEVLSWVH